MQQIEEIINNPKKLITENYIEAQLLLEKTYGNNSILLVQIGSFYEVYGTETKGKAKEIAKYLNIQLTKKNKSILEITEKNPIMCGIPEFALEKHLEKLTSENEWNIAIVNQEGTGSNVTRYFDRIISPGTNTEYLSEEYNFIASIHIEKNKQQLTYGGISLIDASIGKVLVSEASSLKEDLNYAIDSFKSILNKYNTSELIVSYDGFEESEIKSIFDFKFNTYFKGIKDIKKEEKITYQNNLFKESFNLNSILSPIEELNLEKSPYTSLSLSVLISFIIEHNYSLSENLLYPTFIMEDKYLYLGNNPLNQLNIINNGKYSLEKIINKGISSIGRRFIKEQLLNPLKNKKLINLRFLLTNKFLELSEEQTENIKKELTDVYDIERLWRKIQTEKISPFEAYNLYKSFISIKNILNIYKTDLPELYSSTLDNNVSNTIFNIEKSFDIDKILYFNLNNITSSFIKKGIAKELDDINLKLKKETENFLYLVKNINDLFEKTTIPKNVNLKESKKVFSNINICFLEKEGYFIEMTKKKFEQKQSEIITLLGDNAFIKSKTNIKKLSNNQIEEISNKIIGLEQKVISLNKELFQEIMNSFLKELDIFKLSTFIGKTEFLYNNRNLINEYGYKVPEIIESKESFIDVKNLRHPIIERFEHNGIFISNNLVLGHKENHTEYNDEIMQGEDSINGVMLYGLNSSGKTTLSKSLGIAIIMAQAGIPVAANLKFSLFENLFTRIKGDDDLERGLSTFAVEMLELKNILNRANHKTLVLGDEISHGTETVSGLSIVSSAVLELVEKDSLFLFATHLHQLRIIDEFNEESKVKDIHLSVEYNEEKDMLIYDRKIKKGSGSSLYGLEFSKYLKLPKSFLNRAYNIRNKLAEDLSEAELIIQNKKSKYNSKQIITTCEICGNFAEDVHHIKEQHEANENGLIGDIHKNHSHNLVNLCKKHHKDVHSGKILINGYVKTSNGFKLDYQSLY